jgi:hypothetical protein
MASELVAVGAKAIEPRGQVGDALAAGLLGHGGRARKLGRSGRAGVEFSAQPVAESVNLPECVPAQVPDPLAAHMRPRAPAPWGCSTAASSGAVLPARGRPPPQAARPRQPADGCRDARSSRMADGRGHAALDQLAAARMRSAARTGAPRGGRRPPARVRQPQARCGHVDQVADDLKVTDVFGQQRNCVDVRGGRDRQAHRSPAWPVTACAHGCSEAPPTLARSRP